MPIVTFLPDGHRVEAADGARLMGIVQRASRPIGASCRGRGVCVACRLRVVGPMRPPDEAERRLLMQVVDETDEARGAWRIACLARIAGDVEVRADYW